MSSMVGRNGLGPLVLVREPAYERDGLHRLRSLVQRHDDAAWLLARPPTGKTTLPAFGQDLLDATGVVGLRAPRSVGETHTLRLLPHWLHGPVRHVVIRDAHDIDPAALEDALHTAVVTGVTLWLVNTGAAPKASWLTWAAGRAGGALLDLETATRLWDRQPVPPGLCSQPEGRWWLTDAWWSATTACALHDERARCVLSWIRRGAGNPTPSASRSLLQGLLAHDATTPDDHWAFRDASRDLLTPAMDVIAQIGLNMAHRDLTVADVRKDGRAVQDRGTGGRTIWINVPSAMRLALRRQLSAQIWAGGSPETPLLGIFGEPAWM